MTVQCDGCSRILPPAEEDGALVINDAPHHRWRLCRTNGCAAAIERVIDPAILALRVEHGKRQIARRAMNIFGNGTNRP